MLDREIDAKDFCIYLTKIYEDRVCLVVNKSYGNCYYITGSFDGEPINFELNKHNGDLIMYSNYSNCEFINSLIPSIVLFMDGKKPIAKYNSVDKDNNNVSTTVEWCGELDNRIRSLRKNESSLLFEFSNVRTFVETTEEREKRLGFTELSPIFFPDGKLDNYDELIRLASDYSEQDAYLALKSLSSVYFQLQTDRRNDYTYADCNMAMSIILSRISCFLSSDFESPIDVFYSREYELWDRSWSNYFSYDIKCQYMEARLNGEDTACFSPNTEKKLKYIPRG